MVHLRRFGICLFVVVLGCMPVTATDRGARANNFNVSSDTSKLTPVPAEALTLELKDLEGHPLKIADYAGKVVVISLWATWCGPCRKEMPELELLTHEYQDRDVVLLGLTTKNNDEDPQLVKNYVRDNLLTFRTIYEDGRFYKLLAGATNARAVIPQSYVITRDGKILTHFEGYDFRSTPKTMRKMIDLALSFKT